MERLWNGLGVLLFWLLWPVWFLYLKRSPLRTRVLVTSRSQALLLKPWLGVNKWSLPGGGLSKGESHNSCAVRELYEETGVKVPESALRDLGEVRHLHYGLRYRAHYFTVELPEPPPVKPRWPEISAARWHDLSDIRGRMLDQDAAYALKQYVPLDQTALL